MDLIEMATNKRAVSVYLDDDVLDYVEKYCTEFDVMGKDKYGNTIPRLATGIHDLLKQLILITPVNGLVNPLKKNNNSTVLSTLDNLDSHVLCEINDRLIKLESIVYSQDNSSTLLNKIVNDSIDTVMDLEDKSKELIGEDITDNSTPLECDILPLNQDDSQIIPTEKETFKSEIIELNTNKSDSQKEEISIKELESRLSKLPEIVSADVVSEVFEITREYLAPTKVKKLSKNKREVLGKLEIINNRPKTYHNPYSELDK